MPGAGGAVGAIAAAPASQPAALAPAMAPVGAAAPAPAPLAPAAAPAPAPAVVPTVSAAPASVAMLARAPAPRPVVLPPPATPAPAGALTAAMALARWPSRSATSRTLARSAVPDQEPPPEPVALQSPQTQNGTAPQTPASPPAPDLDAIADHVLERLRHELRDGRERLGFLLDDIR